MNIRNVILSAVGGALAAVVTAGDAAAQLGVIEPSLTVRDAPAPQASLNLLAIAAAPSFRGFVVSARAAGTMGDFDAPGSLVVEPWAHLSYRWGSAGAWIGNRLAPVPAFTGAAPFWEQAARTEAGIWKQLGGAVFSLTLRRGISAGARSVAPRGVSRVTTRVDTLNHTTVVDTVFSPAGDSGSTASARAWSAAEGRVSWARGPWALDVATGTSLGTADLRASLWRRAEVSFAVTPRVALVAAGGTSPASSPLLPLQRFASLGLRMSARAFAPSAGAEPVRPVAASFAVRRAGDSSYTVVILVPRARTVEISGDFTGWKPVGMRATGVDRWEATLRMEPGTYRVSIRVDGDAWIAPPGVATVHDEFVGAAGLVVVE